MEKLWKPFLQRRRAWNSGRVSYSLPAPTKQPNAPRPVAKRGRASGAASQHRHIVWVGTHLENPKAPPRPKLTWRAALPAFRNQSNRCAANHILGIQKRAML